jgi:hypothetical protein
MIIRILAYMCYYMAMFNVPPQGDRGVLIK